MYIGPSQTLNVKECYQVIGSRCALHMFFILKMKMKIASTKNWKKERRKETEMLNDL